MAKTDGKPKAAIAFILLTLFIDILGIGIVIPVLPELIKQFVGGDTSMAGRYYGVIAASYALMQFLCARSWAHFPIVLDAGPYCWRHCLGWGSIS